MLLNSRKHPDFCGHQRSVGVEWRETRCSLHVSSGTAAGQVPPSGKVTWHLLHWATPTDQRWDQPVAHSHSLMDSLSLPFSTPNRCRVLQRFLLPAWAGCSGTAPPSCCISHGFLIAQSSGQLSPNSLQPDVWANYPQHCSETHWEWLWTYDPNYFWFPAWMILSASGLSLSNLWHSKFPHSVLK